MSAFRRILFLTSQLGRNGGTAAHVLDSAEALASSGYEVSMISGTVPSDAQVNGVDIIEVPGMGEADVPEAARRRIEEKLLRQKPDVVHIHDLLDVDWLLSLRKYAPIVWSVHNYFGCMTGDKYFKPGQECTRPHGPGCIFNSVVRGCDHRRVRRPSLGAYRRTGSLLRAAREADVTVVYSQFVQRQLQTNGVRDVRVVPLFARATSIKPLPQSRHVTFSGRIVTQKGIDVLLRAAARIDDLIVHICGDGWGMARVQGLAEELGLGQRVRFEGWQSAAALSRFYESSDVVVVPSVWPEPFGLVGIEAMSHGRPVIASRTGGIPEWLSDGQTGLLVPPGDVEALSVAVAWMLGHPREAQAMGRAAARDVAARYSVPAFLAATKPVYEAAVEGWERAVVER